MSLRYYVLGSVALLCALYFSKDIRDLRLPDLRLPDFPSWKAESLAPRQAHSDIAETRQTVKEQTALKEWIDSRLTQKGLKDMTESGHWQSGYAPSL